jgi:hypothetical protein
MGVPLSRKGDRLKHKIGYQVIIKIIKVIKRKKKAGETGRNANQMYIDIDYN